MKSFIDFSENLDDKKKTVDAETKSDAANGKGESV